MAYCDFKELKDLGLCDNNISDINVLGNCNFENLNLRSNKISNIKILVNFKNLKMLIISGNEIEENVPILIDLKSKIKIII